MALSLVKNLMELPPNTATGILVAKYRFDFDNGKGDSAGIGVFGVWLDMV